MPSCDLRRQIGRIRPICAALLILLPACSDGIADACADAPDPAACRADADAGRDGFSDGGPGGGLDAGMDPAVDGGSVDAAAPSELDEAARGGLFACANGVDDDANSAPDCEDAACGASSYCCVGAGRAACCSTLGRDLGVDFAACAGPEPADCAPSLRAFGAPPSRLETGGFVPGGDDLGDSGLELGSAVDLRRERVTLTATIAARPDGCESPGCLDVVAFGLGDAPTAAPHRVSPEVAVFVRASRGDYALVVAGEVAATGDIESEDPQVYRLSASPDGTVSLQVGGASPTTARMQPRAGLTPMLWGRSFELAGSAEWPARVSSVQVSSWGCDMPDGLARPATPAIPFAGPSFVTDVTSPSAVLDGSEILLAFVYQGAVHLARHDGAWRLAGSGSLASPALVVGVNERVEDPRLVRRAARYDLYVTFVGSDGRARIGLAHGGAWHAETFDPVTPLELPDDELREYRSPAVLDRPGADTLLAAVSEDARRSVIVLFAAPGPDGPFDYANGTFEASVIAEPGPDLGHFAADEVDDPELFAGGRGLLRLYYAGRRGTRWAIGARVNGGVLDTWRDPYEGEAILSGSGVGFDALSVHDPAVVLDGDGLWLFHTASDGVRASIGRAEGAAP